MEKYISISSIIEKMKKQMLEDWNLKKRVDRVADGANKSQKQTPCSDRLPDLKYEGLGCSADDRAWVIDHDRCIWSGSMIRNGNGKFSSK